MKLNLLIRVSLLLLLGACSQEPGFYTSDAYPDKLSDWGLIEKRGTALWIEPKALVYDLNMPLFSDYASKLRTLHLPAGAAAQFQSTAAFDFPAGTVVTKTFFYSSEPDGRVRLESEWRGDPSTLDLASTKLIETRLLIRQADRWDAIPYVWDGDDARIAITGDLLRLTASEAFAYLVPSKNQCASCHATDHTSGAVEPIGLKARHLNRLDPVTRQPQLELWRAAGHLTGANVVIEPTATYASDDLDHLARSYLDVNCGHCHNPRGPADTSALLLDYDDHPQRALGVCKPPVAAGRGSGGRLYSIVPGKPDESILTFRMETKDPGAMMPELGRSLVHHEGIDIIRRWIASLSGACR